MPSRNIKVTVTTLSGERVEVDVAPAHTAQDLIGALIQGGKLPGEDSSGQPMHYELVDSGLSLLPGDKPLIDAGVKDGADLRVKPGSRVAAGGIQA